MSETGFDIKQAKGMRIVRNCEGQTIGGKSCKAKFAASLKGVFEYSLTTSYIPEFSSVKSRHGPNDSRRERIPAKGGSPTQHPQEYGQRALPVLTSMTRSPEFHQYSPSNERATACPSRETASGLGYCLVFQGTSKIL